MGLQVKVDWTDVNDFDALAINDLTPYLQSAAWQIGMRRPYQLVADGTKLTAQLRNDAGRFTPENIYALERNPYLSGKRGWRLNDAVYSVLGDTTWSTGYDAPRLEPHRRIQVSWDDGATETVLWTGWIEKIDVPWGVASGNTQNVPITITAVDAKKLLDQTVVNLDPYTNVTADEVIGDVITQAKANPGGAGDWLLGHYKYSILGTTTYLGNVGDLETGVVVFPSYGDLETGKAMAVIKELLNGERGKFYIARDGTPTFWNRHHLVTDKTDDANIVTYSGLIAPTELDYQFGANHVNVARVKVKPRKTEAASEQLWELPSELVVPPDSTVAFDAILKTLDGVAVGADATLAATTGFSGGESNATVSVDRRAGRGAIEVSNSSAIDPVIIDTLTLDAAAIVDQNESEHEERDEVAVNLYGLSPININAGAVGLREEGRYIAESVIFERGMRGEVLSALWNSAINGDILPDMINYGMGTRLAIDCSEYFHTGDYFVIGEQHNWRAGQPLQTTLYFEQGDTDVWQLGTTGFGELEDSTVLGL